MSCSIITAVGKDLYRARFSYTFSAGGSVSSGSTLFTTDIASGMTSSVGSLRTGFYSIEQISYTIKRAAGAKKAAIRVWLGTADFALARNAVFALGSNKLEDTIWVDMATTDQEDYGAASKGVLTDLSIINRVPETNGSPSLAVVAMDANSGAYASGDELIADIIIKINDRT